MARETIEIWMGERQVGTMALTDDGLSIFEYTTEWLRNGFSISPFELPLTTGTKIARRAPFDGCFGVFDDSLPDGWGCLILDRYLKTKGINIASLNLLQQLCLVGSNGRGALEFRPDQSIRETAEFHDFATLAAETEAMLGSDTYTGVNLQELVERGGSPGGARPKIFVKDDDGEWLVKFRSRYDPKDIGKTELRYAELAQECGIEMMPCKLFDNQFFGTMRYDRQHGERQHVISAAGLLNADYRIPSVDYRHLFQLTSLLTNSMSELWRMYRLMCFNVLIGNKDDHAKNFAFIYDNGWRLSPAFDLLPSDGSFGSHTTSVNDSIKPDKSDLLKVATEYSLNKGKAEDIFDEMKSVIAASS